MDNTANHRSEKLVQYLDGELSGPEKEILEKQLAEDPGLKGELESLQEAREAVKLYGLQQKVAGIHPQMMRELQPAVRKMSTSRRILRYGIAVAASVVLIAGGIIGYTLVNLSSGKVFASHFHAYELGTVRGEDTLQISPVEKAYREKDYKKTVELYAQSPDVPVKETFLAGMSYLELGDNTKAIDEFKEVLADNEKTKSGLFKDDAEYFLALTYIRNRDYDYALDLMRSIRDNPEHIYHEKITGKLIRQVKMLKWR
jgi:tetratricopeptide (TPR) repeat protein